MSINQSDACPFKGELERVKGFEPSTPTLARLCSTPELHPRSRCCHCGQHASRCDGIMQAVRPCKWGMKEARHFLCCLFYGCVSVSPWWVSRCRFLACAKSPHWGICKPLRINPRRSHFDMMSQWHVEKMCLTSLPPAAGNARLQGK